MAKSDRHIEAAQRRLVDLAALSAKTDAAERRILEAAEARLKVVEADIGRLQPRAIGDAEAGEQYQQMIIERGTLWEVIARAKGNLGIR